MTIQKEEDDDSDNVDQESFHTCGNELNAKIENQEQKTAVTSGEKTSADITAENEQNTSKYANPQVSYAKNQGTEGRLVVSPPIPSFIKAGLKKKQTAFAIKSWAALALTLDGRDKITKVLQYISRFLGWYLAGGTYKTESIRFNALYKTLANARKAFRLGRSLIEMEKLRPVPGMILWHLQDDEDTASSKLHTHHSTSSNGFGPSAIVEVKQSRRSLLRSLRSVAYQKMYRPLLSRISSPLLPDKPPTQELWKICGDSVKTLGLLLFWAGDNLNFLLSTGALDDYSITTEERLNRRKRRQALFSERGNQAYFVGSLAGLLVNLYAYQKFHRESIEGLHNRESHETEPSDIEVWSRKVKQLKQTQFSLFLGLLKSCCDVAVFSNLPGIDLHKKWRGRANHEGLHCLCGLVSAGTVIYTNFPDSK